MFFGEFLILKKAINEDQLLDALTYQVEHLPSFMRILREEKLIPSDVLFRLIQVQFETNSDLIGVLRDENKIDETQLHNLFAKQASKRKMLGEVLVELKIMDQSNVENMLYDFLRDKENLKTLNTEKQIESVKAVSQSVEISEAALESLRELGMVMDDMPAAKPTAPAPKIEEDLELPTEVNIFVEEFLNVYNSKMKNKLAKILSILKGSLTDDSDISNYINSLYRDIHILKGAAQVGDLAQTEGFISEWEKVIEKILSQKNNEIKVWGTVGIPELEKGLNHLWSMRESIDKYKTEANLPSSTDLLNIVKTL
jgi:hypothetical protein